MTEWICRRKPVTHSLKRILKRWQRVDDGLKRDSGEDNLQTSPSSTESVNLLKSGCIDVNFKHVQPWDP